MRPGPYVNIEKTSAEKSPSVQEAAPSSSSSSSFIKKRAASLSSKISKISTSQKKILLLTCISFLEGCLENVMKKDGERKPMRDAK